MCHTQVFLTEASEMPEKFKKDRGLWLWLLSDYNTYLVSTLTLTLTRVWQKVSEKKSPTTLPAATTLYTRANFNQ